MHFFTGEPAQRTNYTGYKLDINESQIVSPNKSDDGFFLEEAVLKAIEFLNIEKDFSIVVLEGEDNFYIISYDKLSHNYEDTYIFPKSEIKKVEDLELYLSEYNPDEIIYGTTIEDMISFKIGEEEKTALFPELDLTIFLSSAKRIKDSIKKWSLPVILFIIFISLPLFLNDFVQNKLDNKQAKERGQYKIKKRLASEELTKAKERWEKEQEKRKKFTRKKNLLNDIDELNKIIDKTFSEKKK